MDIGAVIERFGYIAVFVGALIEGETVLALAGVAAHRGYLDVPGAVAAAAIGGFVGDQLYFIVGRLWGPAVMRRWPRLAAPVRRANEIIERHEAALILGVRFMYGLRVAGPIAIGMGRTSWARFATLNMIGALLWAPLFIGAGYLLTDALEAVLGDLKHIEHWIFIAVAVAGVVLWLTTQRRRGRR